MDQLAFVERHFNTSSEDVARICYPLFQHTPVKYFDWSRIYDNGELIRLCSNPEFGKASIQNRLVPSTSMFSGMYSQRVSSIILSHCVSPPPDLDTMLNELTVKNIAIAADYNILHRFYIHERGLNYYNFYGFGTDNSSSDILNYYLNFQSTLRKFVNYFEKEAQHVINSAKLNKILYVPNQKASHEEVISTSMNEISELKKILESYERMFIFPELTQNELQCYQYYAGGFTSKYIAKQLKLNYRTVQDNIDRVKYKLKVRTKNQLIEVWNQRYKTLL